MKYTVYSEVFCGIAGEVRLLCSACLLSPPHVSPSSGFLFRDSHLLWSLFSWEVYGLFNSQSCCSIKFYCLSFWLRKSRSLSFFIVLSFSLSKLVLASSHPPASSLYYHMTANQPGRVKPNTSPCETIQLYLFELLLMQCHSTICPLPHTMFFFSRL